MKKTIWLFALLAIVLCLTELGWGQAPQGAPQPAASQNAIEEEAPVEQNVIDMKIPENATPAQLLEFAKKLMTTPRDYDTEEEFTAAMKKLYDTIIKITDLIMAQQTQDHEFFMACGIRAQVLGNLAATNPTNYNDYHTFVTWISSNDRIKGNASGREMILNYQALDYQFQVVNLATTKGATDDLKKIMAQIKDFVIQNPAIADLVLELVDPIVAIAENNKAPELLGEIFGDLYQTFKQSKDASLNAMGDNIAGVVRYTTLVGQSMPLEGTCSDGKPFDSSSCQGKVVLVDFWATWCEPYNALYPSLLAIYQQYHGKGLEIFSYSVDENPETLHKFIVDNKIPWPVVSEALNVQNKQTPLSQYYGITSVPTFILIGKDGKVIDNDVDFQTLLPTLEKLLGK